MVQKTDGQGAGTVPGGAQPVPNPAPTPPAPTPPVEPRPGPPPSEIAVSVRSYGDTLTVPWSPRDNCVADLFRRGDIVTLAARQNTGKTPLITQLGLGLAAGKPFLGLSTTRCRVCMIDLESPWDKAHDMVERQREAMGISQDEISSSFVHLVRGNPEDPNSRILEHVCDKFSLPDRVQWLGHLVVKNDLGALIIDPILDLFPHSSKDEEKIRGLLGELSQIRYRPPYPLLVQTVHLRKPFPKSNPPSLTVDPHAWWDEVLGSVVWATASDVRLGLDRLKEGNLRVFAGYRRGEDPLAPMIIAPAVTEVDGRIRPTMWARQSDAEVARAMLTPDQQVAFFKMPTERPLAWKELLDTTGLAKSSASAFVQRASTAGVIQVVPRDGGSLYLRPDPENI